MIALQDLSGTVRTVIPLTKVEKNYFSAYFKNVDLKQYETEEQFAVQISDAIECLQAVNEGTKEELGSFFVKIGNFAGTENSKIILIMLSDSNNVLKKLFTVEFFSPAASMPATAKLIIRKK